MEHSEWFKETNKKLDYYISSMDRKKANRFRLQLLKRIIERTENFSLEGCSGCEENKESINKLLVMLQENSSETGPIIKSYNITLKKLIEHLQKEHKLVQDEENVTKWMPIGMTLGMCIGMSFGSSGLSMGISIGLAAGVAIGAGMDAKAKKEGKII